QAPPFVEGITNLRGSVLPVMDLRKRFALGIGGSNAEIAHDEKRIVVVSMDGMKIGMIVDAVSEVLRVQDEAIEPPPPMVTTINSAFITGIAKVGERLIILLDLGKVLTLSEKEQVIGLEATS
ncbi:MAG: chemotaxis protein CheW, partial [Anaerolineales bacterium]